MTSVAVLLAVLSRDPGDDGAWLALADALEEVGDARAEATRLSVWLRRRVDDPARGEWETNLRGGLCCLPHRKVALMDSVDLEMVLVPPGTFLMGSPRGEAQRSDDELQHRVTLTKGYWLGTSPVTQEQWQAVMGHNPSKFKGAKRPVERVSWEDCQIYCRLLKERTGQGFRLPTEAEWEYACRAGLRTPFHFGKTILATQGNYADFSYGGDHKGLYRRETTPVGMFPANPWGLLDMHGNVWEWCKDRYGPYDPDDSQDPQGPEEGGLRVLRGGSWNSFWWRCRAAFRSNFTPTERHDYFGCRIVMGLE